MTAQPNVLIIFPDQLRRYAAGYWSKSPYREHVIGKPDPVVTPNLDALAADSLVFTDAISNAPVCSPHRGMLLSGMFPGNNGLINNCYKENPYELKQDLTAITDVFADAGYATAYFGKCHWVKTEPLFDEAGTYVGTTDAPGGHYINGWDTYVPPGPHRHSIEYFYQTVRDAHCNPLVYSSDPQANEGKPDGTPSEPRQLSTKLESTALINYLDNTHSQRDPDKPFFAIWSINPPHGSWADAHVETQYRDRHYNEELFPTTTDLLVRENLIPEAEIEAAHARNYFSAVTSVDHYIGLVIDHLREAGMLDNTLVLFTSDHGEFLGSHFKLGKNQPYHEAYAVPFMLSWPGHIKPGLDHNMISVPDIFPTILGLAGMAERIPDEVQGTNYAALIRDSASASIEAANDALLFTNTHNTRGLVTRDHVLVVHCDQAVADGLGSPEAYLFDNHADPYQMNPIPLDDCEHLAAPLLERLAQRLADIGDAWWQQRTRSDICPWPEPGQNQ